MDVRIKENYRVVKVLSERNGKVLLLRHRTLNKALICRTYEKPVPAYEILKQLHHPNLAEVYDCIPGEGQTVLEEYIDAISVAEVLATGKYTVRGAKRVLRQVCAAVAELHLWGIIHRDIKPENVLIDSKGNVKLIDLNASSLLAPEKRQTTNLLGTIGYAAYEQLGIADCDERTDIFALGVLLNVMLTGEHPSRTLAKGRMGKIVLKCTQIDPDSRYQSVEKLLMAL